MACAPADGDDGPGAGGTNGGSGTSGGAGTGALGGSGPGGSGAGTTGAGGSNGLPDGGTDGGGIDTAPFSCPTLPAGTCTPPADIRCPYPKLSQTGCIAAAPFSDPKIPIKMASVVVPYDINSPLWSDGALKTRGMRLPATGKIHVRDCAKNPAECCVLDPNQCLPPADDGKWVFPVGTVLVKNFFFPDTSRPTGYKLVETRLFVRMDKVVQLQGVDTEWVGYGYQWDDAQTDATIVGTLLDGSDIGVSGTFSVTPTAGAAKQTIKWDYPSRNDCITCHMPISPKDMHGGYSIGPETVQMNRIVAGDTMNQIDKFAALNMFESAPAKPYKAALVAPYPGQSGSPPAGASLETRARSYLHANCSFCHRPDGKFSGFDIRFDVPFKNTAVCNGVLGSKMDLMVPNATILTPKNPATSAIWIRMHAPKGNEQTGGTGRMPSIGSSVIDTQGTELMSQWITSITACPQ